MPTQNDRVNFSSNLRYLCRHRTSASAVARDVGLNRQQFEKYLSGKSFPSENIRHRLAKYFQVPMENLTVEANDFINAHDTSIVDPMQMNFTVSRSNSEELQILRNYIGAYQVFFLRPTQPERICAGLALVTEQDRQIKTVFLTRYRNLETKQLHRSRLVGQMVLRGERLFVIERSAGLQDRFSETILFPAHAHTGRYLTGMSFGISWRPQRMPYASRTIWRRHAPSYDIRRGISDCGVHLPRADVIDPTVRKFFGSDLTAYTLES